MYYNERQFYCYLLHFWYFTYIFQEFFVAGNPQREIQSKRSESRQTRRPVELETSGNVFSGMDERMLAEAFHVNTDIARRLKGEDDFRGMIVFVRVERGLEVLSPQRSPEEERQIREEQQQREFEMGSRGSIRYWYLQPTCRPHHQWPPHPHTQKPPTQCSERCALQGKILKNTYNNLYCGSIY